NAGSFRLLRLMGSVRRGHFCPRILCLTSRNGESQTTAACTTFSPVLQALTGQGSGSTAILISPEAGARLRGSARTCRPGVPFACDPGADTYRANTNRE